MNLTTLVTVCALTVDPKVMHALIRHQSRGEPWALSVPGRREPQVLRNVGEALDAARATQPGEVVTGSALLACRPHAGLSRRRCLPVLEHHVDIAPDRAASSRALQDLFAVEERSDPVPLPRRGARGNGPIPASRTPSARRGSSRAMPRRLRLPRRMTANARARALSFQRRP
jgi:hypothetical protein